METGVLEDLSNEKLVSHDLLLRNLLSRIEMVERTRNYRLQGAITIDEMNVLRLFQRALERELHSRGKA